MTVYIILFRGVGGATQLPTKPLREALTAAGFKDVATYINSGNAILSSRKSAENVVKEVAKICAREFGFDKAVYAVTREQWRDLIENNPFPDALSSRNSSTPPSSMESPERKRSKRCVSWRKKGNVSRWSVRSLISTRPMASVRRKWPKNSTRGSAFRIRRATGTR